MASKQRPLILVTCDDGIDSPGLRAAALAALDLGEVLVSAPCEQQTGAGRSVVQRALVVPAVMPKDQGALVDAPVVGEQNPAFAAGQ